MDIAAGIAVAANDNNAVDAVVSLSSTKDEDAYVGRWRHSKVGAFVAFVDHAAGDSDGDGDGKCR